MLADPFVYPTATGITAGSNLTFNRTSEGIYLLSTATLDEPFTLSLQNTIRPSATSSFVAKITAGKNAPGSPTYGNQPVPDDESSLHIVMRQTHRAHDLAYMTNIRNHLVGLIMNTTFWDQWTRGAR